jgi:hypothetical protein
MSLFFIYLNFGGNDMKILYKEKIGGYSVIRYIADAAVDSEKTKERIAPLIKPKMKEEEAKQLFMENLVYGKPGSEGELIEDARAEQIQKKINEKGDNRLLLDNGKYIPDYCGVEYWIKASGGWAQKKVEEIGLPLPTGAILQDELTEEQQKEISAQKEGERIAALSNKEKSEEVQTRLRALAREANQKAEDAELLEEVFDKQAWFQLKKTEI